MICGSNILPPSCSVFHSKEAEKVNAVDISVMLPIWRDDSKSIATIKHVINVIIRTIDFSNYGQPAVIGFDQPLYAIAKALQWKYLSLHGPEKLIVMLGPLHIEMAVLSCLGDILEESGWTTALANANITSTGNEFLLSGHSIAKTKYAHQVTVFTHSELISMAYREWPADHFSNVDVTSFQQWRDCMESENPQFQFWSIVLQLEMVYCMFLRSIRCANFSLHVFSLQKILLWMFSFDHIHYAQWMSVHHLDMETLSKTNPDIFLSSVTQLCSFENRNSFSSMGLDQKHEQLNKDI